MADVTKYIDLITSEHADKPKFVAMITATTQSLVTSQNDVAALPAAFDVDLAVGQQLDYTGQWVGISRNLRGPLEGVYFAFDTPNVGFDQGTWWQPGDPLEGVISLDDTSYRLLLNAKIEANTWDGTLIHLEQILTDLFAASPGTQVTVQDNMDMSITIIITGVIPGAVFLALLANDYVPFRPEGVKLEGVEATSGKAFAFDIESDRFGGFDEGNWAVPILVS